MENKVCIVIPSYNTKSSINKSITGILKYMPNVRVIVVDDNSPDGTARFIKSKFGLDPRVTLIVRKQKGGRGSAVIRGFKEGLKNKNTKFFIEMDADLCHDPKYLPILIKKCQEYDVVIASKYLKGSVIIGLGLKRLIFSRIVNFYIRLMLGIRITDYTNGYRCYTRKTLEKINFKNISSRGFIVLSEIAYNIYKEGFTFGEIPIFFKYKNMNPSNFNLSEIKEAFFTILRLRFKLKRL